MKPAYLIVALERLEVVKSVDGRRVTNPLQCLPVGDDPNILHAVDEVQKHNETFFVMRLSEPGSMVEQAEWCSGNLRQNICYF